MKIAVLSGKGGAGKTFVAVNLAVCSNNASYIDCDVEEPNGRLFLKPQNVKSVEVTTPIPQFDEEKCDGCRKCVDFCKFNALIYIKNKPMLFNEVCHACGGCEIVCPNGAVTEGKRPIGKIDIGMHNGINVITGILNIGEASGIKVIEKAQEIGFENCDTAIIDCPPGSACSVMESVMDADYCVLVAEPTAFGFHNFKMVHELVSLLKKPCGVIINKEDTAYAPLYDYCKNNNLDILATIPYDKGIANLIASGEIISEHNDRIKAIFKSVIDKIGESLGGATL